MNKNLGEKYEGGKKLESSSLHIPKEIQETHEQAHRQLQQVLGASSSMLEMHKNKLRKEYALLLSLPGFLGEGYKEVIHVDGVKLYKKNEFHVTITGHNYAPLIQNRAEQDPTFMERLEKMIEEQHFYVKDTQLSEENTPYAFISDEKPVQIPEGETQFIKRYALIKPVEIPGVNKLYSWLENELQTKIEPFLHVTLYTNDHKGIGIASYEKFKESFVRRVAEMLFVAEKKEG